MGIDGMGGLDMETDEDENVSSCIFEVPLIIDLSTSGP